MLGADDGRPSSNDQGIREGESGRRGGKEGSGEEGDPHVFLLSCIMLLGKLAKLV